MTACTSHISQPQGGGGGGDSPYLVNVAQSGLLDALVLDNLAQDAAITATNDQDLLGVGVRVHGQVGDHLLVGKLIALSALDDVVQDQDGPVVGGFEDENVLVLGLLVVDDIFDLEGHGLAGPHLGDLAEPAIYGEELLAVGVLGIVVLRCQCDAVSNKVRGRWARGRA